MPRVQSFRFQNSNSFGFSFTSRSSFPPLQNGATAQSITEVSKLFSLFFIYFYFIFLFSLGFDLIFSSWFSFAFGLWFINFFILDSLSFSKNVNNFFLIWYFDSPGKTQRKWRGWGETWGTQITKFAGEEELNPQMGENDHRSIPIK